MGTGVALGFSALDMKKDLMYPFKCGFDRGISPGIRFIPLGSHLTNARKHDSGKVKFCPLMAESIAFECSSP